MVVAVEEGGMGVTNRFEGVAKDGVDWSYWNEIKYQTLSSNLYTCTFYYFMKTLFDQNYETWLKYWLWYGSLA